MFELNYNPDVLTCLANLSNDEVFTPPSLVEDILSVYSCVQISTFSLIDYFTEMEY